MRPRFSKTDGLDGREAWQGQTPAEWPNGQIAIPDTLLKHQPEQRYELDTFPVIGPKSTEGFTSMVIWVGCLLFLTGIRTPPQTPPTIPYLGLVTRTIPVGYHILGPRRRICRTYPGVCVLVAKSQETV
jgi:hypothetical protein